MTKHIASPPTNSKWYHSNGCGPYRVIGVTNTANDNPDHPPQVVYKGKNGKWWSRPLTDWWLSMTPEWKVRRQEETK